MSRLPDVTATASVAPTAPGRAGGLVRRVVSAAVLLPVFVGVVAFAPSGVFLAMVLLVGGIGQWEFTRMFRRAGIRALSGIGLGAGLVVTASFAVPVAHGLAVSAALSAAFVAVLGAGLVSGSRRGWAWESAAVTLLGIGYVNWLLGHALWLRQVEAGVEWVLLLVWVTWLGETAAYLVGSAMGRHPLAPTVSPKKTVEGAVAQLVVSVLAAVVAPGWLVGSLGRWEAVAIGLVLGVVGQIGDLVESGLKRSVGTKDAGQLIPGHGGMLDRVDGLLFNTPVLFYYVACGRPLA